MQPADAHGQSVVLAAQSAGGGGSLGFTLLPGKPPRAPVSHTCQPQRQPACSVLQHVASLKVGAHHLLHMPCPTVCAAVSLQSFEVESCDELACPNLAGLSKVEQLVFRSVVL